jgi:hypothetical protein
MVTLMKVTLDTREDINQLHILCSHSSQIRCYEINLGLSTSVH